MPALVLLALTLARAGTASAAGPPVWTWPVDGPVLSPYSNDNSRRYAAGMHRGVDIGAAMGTPVVAATGGTVTFAGGLGSSGNVVAIGGGDGRTTTTYLHLATAEVKAGESVRAGKRIGTVGMTGKRSVAEPHLHFGVHSSADPDYYYDPLDFLGEQPGAAPAIGVAVPTSDATASLARASASLAPAAVALVEPWALAGGGRVGADGATSRVAPRVRQTADGHAASPAGAASPRPAVTEDADEERVRENERLRSPLARPPLPIGAAPLRQPESAEGLEEGSPEGVRAGSARRNPRPVVSGGLNLWVHVAAVALVLCTIAIPGRRKTRQVDPGARSQAGSRDCDVPADAGGGVPGASAERDTASDWRADARSRLRAVSGSR